MNNRLVIRLGVLVLALGLVYGGLDLAGAAPGANGPPPQTVIVGNTATQPVPVQQQGTASVNVSNASLPVSGTVKIDPGGNGVETTAADNPAFQPVTRACFDDHTGGVNCDLYTVPAGKELVVTTASINITLAKASSTGLSEALIGHVAGGNAGAFYVPVSNVGTGDLTSTLQGGGMTQFYADPGTTVTCSAGSLGSGEMAEECSVDGYLVNVPG
jgi:hypothetical protein